MGGQRLLYSMVHFMNSREYQRQKIYLGILFPALLRYIMYGHINQQSMGKPSCEVLKVSRTAREGTKLQSSLQIVVLQEF